jgi:hypothetical protein
MTGGRPKRIREPGPPLPRRRHGRPRAPLPGWSGRPYATRILLPGPSNRTAHSAATASDRVVLSEASRLACGSCHSASERFRTLGMPEAGRRRGVGRRCGFIGSREGVTAVAALLSLAGELLHRDAEFIRVHGIDDFLLFGVELLPG